MVYFSIYFGGLWAGTALDSDRNWSDWRDCLPFTQLPDYLRDDFFRFCISGRASVRRLLALERCVRSLTR